MWLHQSSSLQRYVSNISILKYFQDGLVYCTVDPACTMDVHVDDSPATLSSETSGPQPSSQTISLPPSAAVSTTSATGESIVGDDDT